MVLVCVPLWYFSFSGQASLIFSSLAHSRCSADNQGISTSRDPERGFVPSRTTVHSHMPLRELAKVTHYRPVHLSGHMDFQMTCLPLWLRMFVHRAHGEQLHTVCLQSCAAGVRILVSGPDSWPELCRLMGDGISEKLPGCSTHPKQQSPTPAVRSASAKTAQPLFSANHPPTPTLFLHVALH